VTLKEEKLVTKAEVRQELRKLLQTMAQEEVTRQLTPLLEEISRVVAQIPQAPEVSRALAEVREQEAARQRDHEAMLLQLASIERHLASTRQRARSTRTTGIRTPRPPLGK
jgi:hypothetical protein